LIFPVDKEHDRRQFACGEPRLDQFIRQEARQSSERRFTRTFVCLDQNKVTSFITLINCSIRNKIQDQHSRGLPRGYGEYPAIKIARFATDENYQGKGFGKRLLAFALDVARRHSEESGLSFVVVDAKHETAAKFYEHCGFRRCLDDNLILYLTIQEIIQEWSRTSS
jgi:GNAT superfamily N-acetyltransferase